MFLTSRSSIKPGDSIELKANAIKSQFSAYSAESKGKAVSVAAPKGLPKPEADISAPSEVGRYDQLCFMCTVSPCFFFSFMHFHIAYYKFIEVHT